jgi:hypothetical protein
VVGIWLPGAGKEEGVASSVEGKVNEREVGGAEGDITREGRVWKVVEEREERLVDI